MGKKNDVGSVIVDLDRCMACKACETACAVAHSQSEDLTEAIMAGEPMAPRVKVVAAAGSAVPVQCQHCEDAPCVEVCPSGALYKNEEDGGTLTAPEKCIGCKACVFVCPFGAVEWNEEAGSVLKCDLCQDIVEEGEEPACVSACPTRARRIVTVKEAADERRKAAAEHTVAVHNRQKEES